VIVVPWTVDEGLVEESKHVAIGNLYHGGVQENASIYINPHLTCISKETFQIIENTKMGESQ